MRRIEESSERDADDAAAALMWCGLVLVVVLLVVLFGAACDVTGADASSPDACASLGGSVKLGPDGKPHSCVLGAFSPPARAPAVVVAGDAGASS